MSRKFLGRWITYEINGESRRAKIEDIEFHTKLGPIFHMVSPYGNRFRFTREELNMYEKYA